ncbi:putative ribosome biogenesis GTPase RsgA [Tateyamaria omphalii]|uniref:ribosome small subunit-dependent GTPase A n=1 Tax=Tateyamaria omphalii TaxID=299262 RepID=UPI001676834E|nr:ribosome small subunit-dependent GTPase A [Tateyamaria omphalii]GGX49605.1 putative ribosome biogenesis GTPase RsgA [Tateyamaria omphalii]
MTRDYSQFFPKSSPPKANAPSLSPLTALGWQSFFAQQTDVDELTQTPPVRVAEVHRNALHVRGDGVDDVIPPVDDATVGDWLMLDRDHPKSSRVLDRKSLIKRRAPGTDRREQLIAANVDTAFVVTSCNQDFKVARLERYVALAFEAQITPVIILTKTDLAPDHQHYVDAARAISDHITIVALDATGDAPRSQLAAWCKPGATVAFLGSSGVGKSTLTNALLGAETLATQSIREDDAKGRHTTTRRQLFAIPNGCLVLDTPGMRELQLTDAASGIRDVFSDMDDLSGQCRFKDCKHETEPGCAVLEAVESGHIDPSRLARWRKLMAEDAFNSASLSERRAKDKAFGKMVREITKQKSKRR